MVAAICARCTMLFLDYLLLFLFYFVFTVLHEFRIFLVFLCIAFIWKIFAPRHRSIVTAVLLAFLTIGLEVLYAYHREAPEPFSDVVLRSLAGYAACWAIAGIIMCCFKLLDTVFWTVAAATVVGMRVANIRRRQDAVSNNRALAEEQLEVDSDS